MKKLVILDYRDGKVHVYNISPSIEIDESYILKLGFKHTECEWMTGNLDIVYHGETLE